MTTDREPTECSESEIRSLSPTFQYLDSFYSDKNGSSLILFCDEGSYPDSSLNSSKTSTITVKRPVSPFPLVLDNSCCSQPSESSLQLFYTDTPNSSFHPFCTDSPIRPTISPIHLLTLRQNFHLVWVPLLMLLVDHGKLQLRQLMMAYFALLQNRP